MTETTFTSRRRLVWRRFLRNRPAVVSLVLLVAVVLPFLVRFRLLHHLVALLQRFAHSSIQLLHFLNTL